jgi:branched-chain amino acid aminotransferase
MYKDRKMYVNGRLVPWEKATVHLMSHSFCRGSGIFEVMRLHKTEKGRAIFRLDDHLDRLQRTADLLGMTLPMEREAFAAAISETVRGNTVENGYVKLICYYGHVAVKVMPNQKTMDLCIAVIDPETDLEGETSQPDRPLHITLCRTRKLHPETIPIEAKAAANYLNGMLSRIEAAQKGADVGIMMDTQGFLAEGSTESIFLVQDGILMTPAEGTVLKSISRKTLLELAPALGIRTVERRLKPEILMEADEIFLSSTGGRTQAVGKVEDRTLAAPGPITQRLSKAIESITADRDSRFSHWLTYVG